MSRRITVKKNIPPLSEVATKILDEIYNKHVKCKKFVVLNASESLRDVLAKPDPEKIRYVINFRSKLHSVDTSTRVVDAKIADGDLERYSGTVVFYDAREDTGDLINFLERVRRSAYVVIFLKTGLSLSFGKRWITSQFEIEGYNIQFLTNVYDDYLDCEKSISKIETFVSDIGRRSPHREERREDISTKKQEEISKPLPGPSKYPQPPKKQPNQVVVPPPDDFKDKKSFVDVLRNLPEPYETSQVLQPFSEEWIVEFRLYIQSLIRMFCKGLSETLVEKLTEERFIPFWIPAFVHISVNPNVGSNFEQLEAIGDAYLTAQFKIYLALREPLIQELQLNERRSRYLSKEFQRLVGQKMKVEKWVVIRSNHISESVKEDIFESFSGALGRVGDLLIPTSGGLGSVLIFNLIKTIFDGAYFDDRYDYGSDITIADQLIKKWNLNKRITRSDEDQEKHITIYHFTTGFKEFLDSYSKVVDFDRERNFPNDELYISFESPIKEVSQRNAALRLMEKLEESKITRKLLTSKSLVNTSSYIQNPEYHRLVDQVMARIMAEGYMNAYIDEPKNMTTFSSHMYILIGEKPGQEDGKKALFVKEYPAVSRRDDDKRRHIFLQDYLNSEEK